MRTSTNDGHRQVLVVCTANIARSPLVAAVLGGHVRLRGLDAHIEVCSAGIATRRDDPAAEPTVEIARRWGLALEEHRSQPVTDELLATSDLVVTMTERQRDHCSARGRGIGTRCFTLPELARLLDSAELADLPAHLPARFDDAILAAHRTRPFSSATGEQDVDDPYGRAYEHYVVMANRIAGLLMTVSEALLGPAPTADGHPLA